VKFDDGLSLRDARGLFRQLSGYSEAQYQERWVKLRFGPLPFWFPNTQSRQRAVKLHDLHHVLTEYGTSWTGEAEISAWELASGCRDYAAAWVLNGLGLLMGVVIAPIRVARAFRRGLQSRNLYGREVTDELLSARVGTLRKALLLKPV
jgi:hypothetical protein